MNDSRVIVLDSRAEKAAQGRVLGLLETFLDCFLGDERTETREGAPIPKNSKDLPICSPWTFRENHSPNIIYTVNRRNQPTAMDLYFLDWVRTRYKTEPETHTKSAHTVL